MGNLIINKVKYSGEKYSFESPILQKGINIIVGDNGSGKSTFTYFIDYGLGGDVKPFKRDSKNDRYKEITNETNNYIELDVTINQDNYVFKRFIDSNDIFIKQEESISKFSVNREANSTLNTFSDWLLDKLNIHKFQLNLGTISWYFNFKDLFRLLYYDQDTEPKKIYKSPSSDNFVTDSLIIRKSIFEILVGISTNDYFNKLNELKKIQKDKDLAEAVLNNFLSSNPNLNIDNKSVSSEIDKLENQLEKLTNERDLYQKQNTNAGRKTAHLSEIQSEIIELELRVSDNTLKRNELSAESKKIEALLKNINQETIQIEKIIFTHDKLNLFSLEVCPFCMSTEIKKEEGYCICHSEIKDVDYEKFVYKSSEYKTILQHKKKNIDSIKIALNSYNEDIDELERNIKKDVDEVVLLKEKLTKIIMAIEFSGNSQFIDDINNKIIEIKEELFNNRNLLNLLNQKIKIEKDFDEKKQLYKNKGTIFRGLHAQFEKNNKNVIDTFNQVFNILMSNSSYKSKKAEIDDSYMPHIDEGEYRQKSADVPKRMMYYFALLCLALKLPTVKHPKFLLIDTPETVGIDKDNLDVNIRELDKIIEIAKESNKNLPDYQVILTTGYDKYPTEYEQYVRLRLNKAENNFILKEKQS